MDIWEFIALIHKIATQGKDIQKAIKKYWERIQSMVKDSTKS